MATARYVTTFVPIGRVRRLVYSMRRIRIVEFDNRAYIVRERIIPSGARADNYCVRAAGDKHREEFGKMLGENSHDSGRVSFASDVPLR